MRSSVTRGGTRPNWVSAGDAEAIAASIGAILIDLLPGRRLGATLLSVARTAQCLTQSDLGRLIDVSRGTIARWETARTAIPATAAIRIEQELGIPAILLRSTP